VCPHNACKPRKHPNAASKRPNSRVPSPAEQFSMPLIHAPALVQTFLSIRGRASSSITSQGRREMRQKAGISFSAIGAMPELTKERLAGTS